MQTSIALRHSDLSIVSPSHPKVHDSLSGARGILLSTVLGTGFWTALLAVWLG